MASSWQRGVQRPRNRTCWVSQLDTSASSHLWFHHQIVFWTCTSKGSKHMASCPFVPAFSLPTSSWSSSADVAFSLLYTELYFPERPLIYSCILDPWVGWTLSSPGLLFHILPSCHLLLAPVAPLIHSCMHSFIHSDK